MDRPQSATFTVSADSPGELARLLRRIADALDGGAGPDARDPSAGVPGRTPATTESGWPGSAYQWDVDRVRELWYRLETPAARHALSHLARQDAYLPVIDLANEVGKEPGPALAGTLSPIGRAVTAMGAPPPYRRVRSHYEVDPEFARSMQAFLADEETRELSGN